MRILSKDEIEDLVVGTSILGVGGGGDPDYGLKLLLSDLNADRDLKIVDVRELPKDSIVVCTYFCGALPAPGESNVDEEEFRDEDLKSAVRAMEEYIGKPITGVIATELGGGNTPVALHVASLLNLPLVDGDQVGRAVPELVHTTYYLHDIPAYPSVLASRDGDLVIVKRFRSMERYEEIARTFAVTCGGSAFVVDSPLEAEKVSEVAVIGTISKCIELGSIIRRTRAKGGDLVRAITEYLDGYHLFTGKVKKYDLKVEGGFLVGEVVYEGVDKWEGQTFRVWVKNENIMAWLNDRVAVMPPDLICIVNDEGLGVTNSQLKIGLKVNIIGVKAPCIWRTDKGLELLGPKHFNFNIEYKPIEELVGNFNIK